MMGSAPGDEVGHKPSNNSMKTELVIVMVTGSHGDSKRRTDSKFNLINTNLDSAGRKMFLSVWLCKFSTDIL